MSHCLDDVLDQYSKPVQTEGTDFALLTLKEAGGVQKHIIGVSEMGDMMSDYCDLVLTEKANICTTMALAEPGQAIMPVLSELTFKYLYDAEESFDEFDKCPPKVLYYLTMLYQNVLEESFDIDYNEHGGALEFFAVILQSAEYYLEDHPSDSDQQLICWEVRIQFPYARVSLDLQNQLIRPRILDMLKTIDLFKDYEYKPLESWANMIRIRSPNDPFLYYGSAVSAMRPKLVKTHIWSHIDRDTLEQITNFNAKTCFHVSLKDAFEPVNHGLVRFKRALSPEFMASRNSKHWLPLFLNLDNWLSVLNERAQKMQVTPVGVNRRITAQYTSGRIITNDADIAEEMLNIMSKSRFLQATFFGDIGRAVHKAHHGGPKGLETWIRHANAAIVDKHNIPSFMLEHGSLQETCRQHYENNFYNSHVSVKTLAWYAREDNPDAYELWHKDICTDFLNAAIEHNHNHAYIMAAFKMIYWLDFVCQFMGSGANAGVRWWKYSGQRWVESFGGAEIRNTIDGNFCRRIEEVGAAKAEEVYATHRGARHAADDGSTATMKKIYTLTESLGDIVFKGKLLRQAADMFYCDNFTDMLDTNPNLTGLVNGVCEVIGDAAIFRLAKPEDYISMSTAVPYRMLTKDSPTVVKTMGWLEQVFPDPPTLHHFLKYCSSFLVAGNIDKVFAVFTGNGHNGKSMIIKMFEAVFNVYCFKFPIGTLTEKFSNAGAPSPQLARGRNARIACMDEPESTVPIATGSLKRLTGGDSYYARKLHDNGGDIKSTFKTILSCNRIPVVPDADPATIDRFLIFPFEAKWIDNPPTDPEECKAKRLHKKIGNFEQQIPGMASAFLWILMDKYSTYAKEKLIDIPDNIKKTMEQYWRDNDIYAMFTSEHLRQAPLVDGMPDERVKISIQSLYDAFKEWHHASFPKISPPDRPSMKAAFSSRWSAPVDGGWYGWEIVGDEKGHEKKKGLPSKPAPVAPPATNTNATSTKTEAKATLLGMLQNDNSLLKTGMLSADDKKIAAIMAQKTLLPAIMDGGPPVEFEMVSGLGVDIEFETVVPDGAHELTLMGMV